MVSLEDRIGCAISGAELDRRWSAARAAMDKAGIDALLIQNNNDYLGGYVKWFSDVPATTGYPTTLIFRAPGDIRFISQGRFGLDAAVTPDMAGVHRGVSRILGAPGYASAHQTGRYEAESVARAIADLPRATVGLLGSAITANLLDHLRETYPDMRFVQASDLIDPIKADKSAEEMRLIRRAAAMQDECMAAVRDAIRPGMRDMEVGAIAERVGRDHGSEQGIFLVASAPPGAPPIYGIRRYQNRVIELGDTVSVLIENSGPGGFYTELGRSFVLGQADPALLDAARFVTDAQERAVALLAAGDSPHAVWDAVNDWQREAGFAEETRLFAHGQGYDLVERPLIRFDEPMPLGRTSNIACHPTVVTPILFASCCDNFEIAGGQARRLHRFDRAVTEIA